MNYDRLNKEYRFLDFVERKKSVLYRELDIDSMLKNTLEKENNFNKENDFNKEDNFNK